MATSCHMAGRPVKLNTRVCLGTGKAVKTQRALEFHSARMFYCFILSLNEVTR